MRLYYLSHERRYWQGHVDSKALGVYTGIEKIDLAVERLLQQPGFKENPQGFRVQLFDVGLPLKQATPSSGNRRQHDKFGLDDLSKVFVLYYVAEPEEIADDLTVVGLFLSKEELESAIRELSRHEPYKECSGKLDYSEVGLNVTGWTEGFGTASQ